MGVQAATGQLQKTHSPWVHVIDACWACTGHSLGVIKQWQQFPGSPWCALVGFRYMLLKFLPHSNLHQISEPKCPTETFNLAVLQEGLQLPSPPSEIYSQANMRRDKLQMVTAEYQYLFYTPDLGFLSREVHWKSRPHSSNSSVGLVMLREIQTHEIPIKKETSEKMIHGSFPVCRQSPPLSSGSYGTL